MIDVSQTYCHRCYETNRTGILKLKQKGSNHSDDTDTSNHYFLHISMSILQRGVVAKDS
jgi:hypothetical protein